MKPYQSCGPHWTYGWLRRPELDSHDEGYCYEAPDGTLYQIPASKAESVKAVIFDSPNGYSPQPAKYDSSDPIIDEADLVSVGLQHHSRCLGIRSIQNGPGVAVGVGFDAVGEGGDVFDPKLLALFFPTGRARDGEDFEEVFGFHISEWVDLDLF